MVHPVIKIIFMLGTVLFVAMTGVSILPQLRNGGMVRQVYAWPIVIVNSGIIFIMLNDIFKKETKQ